jgi:hypothetical protein
MKPAKKITRVQLKISSDDEAPLLGIVTAEPDYKLSLTLNRTLLISLRNSDPVEITDESGIIRHFSRFEYTSGHHISYSLISNRSENEVLIKKHPKIDYFFRINADEDEPDFESITATLRSIGSVTAVFLLNRKDIKDKNIEYLF